MQQPRKEDYRIALVKAYHTLCDIGWDWEDVPGWVRYDALEEAHAMERLGLAVPIGRCRVQCERKACAADRPCPRWHYEAAIAVAVRANGSTAA